MATKLDLTPEEGWRIIHSHSWSNRIAPLYLAGDRLHTPALGCPRTSVYFFALFAIAELAPGFEASYPWYRGAAVDA